MLAYCFHIILASSLFFIFYNLVLEKQKMHVFKRVYLLASILISLIVPAIDIPVGVNYTSPAILDQFQSPSPIESFAVAEVISQSSESDQANIIFAVYLLFALLGLLRIISMLLHIQNTRRKGMKVRLPEATLILIDKPTVPYSFFKSVFVSRTAFESGEIDPVILKHEFVHVKQRHSWDILAIEVVQALCWFNPIYMLFKRAIQLNHEFLADEGALRNNQPVDDYQVLILSQVKGTGSSSLTSHFNYSYIKKRLVMLNTKTSVTRKWLYSIMAAIFSGLLFMVFTFSNITAQPSSTKNSQSSSGQKENNAIPQSTGASADMLKEFQELAEKFIADSANYHQSFPISDRNRMTVIFNAMSDEQRRSQLVYHWPKPPLVKEKHPTDQQLKTWSSGNYYVRMDGYKIKNNLLQQFAPADLVVREIYYPGKGATDYGKYIAQVSVMKKKTYDEYVVTWKNAPKYTPTISMRKSIGEEMIRRMENNSQ